MTRSVLVEIARVVAQVCAFVGVVAGFWHILWIAGVGMLASGLVGVAVHSAGYVGLERDQEPPPQEVEEPGDTDSSRQEPAWRFRRRMAGSRSLRIVQIEEANDE
jgi:hypothetical protein